MARGKLAWKKKDYEKAAEWLSKAVQSRSKFPEVYETIGLMWISQGGASQASAQLDVAEKLFLEKGAGKLRMEEFYTSVINALGGRKTKSLQKAWKSKFDRYKSSN